VKDASVGAEFWVEKTVFLARREKDFDGNQERSAREGSLELKTNHGLIWS